MEFWDQLPHQIAELRGVDCQPLELVLHPLPQLSDGLRQFQLSGAAREGATFAAERRRVSSCAMGREVGRAGIVMVRRH
jgi:hypothetical protein